MKKSPSQPGPGAHFVRPKGNNDYNFAKEAKMGKSDKSEGLNYISTCQYYGSQTPGPGNLMAKPEERDKVYEKVHKRNP